MIRKATLQAPENKNHIFVKMLKGAVMSNRITITHSRKVEMDQISRKRWNGLIAVGGCLQCQHARKF